MRSLPLNKNAMLKKSLVYLSINWILSGSAPRLVLPSLLSHKEVDSFDSSYTCTKKLGPRSTKPLQTTSDTRVLTPNRVQRRVNFGTRQYTPTKVHILFIQLITTLTEGFRMARWNLHGRCFLCGIHKTIRLKQHYCLELVPFPQSFNCF